MEKWRCFCCGWSWIRWCSDASDGALLLLLGLPLLLLLALLVLVELLLPSMLLLLVQTFTVQRHQQLRLAVELCPPTSEAMAKGDACCSGQLLISYPMAQPSGSTSKNSMLKRLLLLTQKLQQQQIKPQLEALEEQPLFQALLGGVLRVLWPEGDPLTLLLLGFSALQEQHKRGLQGAGQSLLLLQYQKLLQRLDAVLPKVSAAACALLAEKSSCEPFDESAAAAPASSTAASLVSYRTQVVSLVGLSRQAFLLLWAPPEMHGAAGERGWCSYCDPQRPLVIDFQTIHVESRQRPSKVLQVRAVSTTAVDWRVILCGNSNSGNSITKRSSNESEDVENIGTATQQLGLVSAFPFASLSA